MSNGWLWENWWKCVELREREAGASSMTGWMVRRGEDR